MKRQNSYVFSIVFCMIVLSLLLTACGTGGGSVASSTPIPTPSPISTPLPTPSPASASGLTVYKGQGYTIDYPQGWTVKATNLAVTFSDATGLNSFTLSPIADPELSNPSASVLENAGIEGGLRDFKATAQNAKDVSITPTITVHGVTWEQGAATGDMTAQGQTVNEQMVVMATHNQSQHLTYVLTFTAPTASFGASNSTYFQPMAQSLTFA